MARAIAFAATIGVAGAVAFYNSVVRRWPTSDVHPPAPWAERARRAGACAAGSMLLIEPLRLYTQASSLVLAGDPVAPMMANVLGTMWGRGWLLQTTAAVVALAAFVWIRHHAISGWTLAFVASLALTLSPALMGHAIAAEHSLAISVLTDWIHVTAAGAWIGGLALLTLVAVAADTGSGAAMATGIELFHPIALAGAAALVVSGAVSVVLRIDSLSDLVRSTYGAILAVKLVLTLGVASVGLHNARRGARNARGRGRSAVAPSLVLESVIAAMVIATTALLVGTSPPMSGADMACVPVCEEGTALPSSIDGA